MKLSIYAITMVVILSSCSIVSPKPSGGPCDYVEMNVTFEIVEILKDSTGYKIRATPLKTADLKVLEDSYTDDTYSVDNLEGVTLNVGDTFSSQLSVMTSGSCNPYPRSIKYSEGLWFDVK